MFGLGFPELIVILVVALVIFGPGKLPELGSGLGHALRDFRKAFEGGDDTAAEAKETQQTLDEKPGERHEPPKT